MRAEWRELDTKIEALNGEFIELARNNAAAQRLTSIPGVGVLNATALVAAVGNASGFAKARDLGAWLGLVPRQHTTGGKARLLGISKRGNTYLRTLLIHGARAALPSLSQADTPLGRWLKAMIERGVHRNVVVVALANKLADRLGGPAKGNKLRAQLCDRSINGSAARQHACSPRGLQEGS
jgi:transposase